MKKTSHPVLTTNVTATADIDRARFISFDGGTCAVDMKALGTLSAKTAVGEQALVDTHGVILVETAGAIALGAEVQSDSDGCAITLDGGQPNGWAMDEATTAGEIIRIARGI